MSEIVFLVYTPFGKGRYFGIVFFCCVKNEGDQMKKEYVTLRLNDIVPYENNPRHNDEAVEYVAESIKQCGYISPIVIDEDNVILCGHTRLKALKSLGNNEAEVMKVTGLTEEQKKKYRILDNHTNTFAEFDMDLLADELEGLDFDGFDFGLIADEIIDESELDADEDKTDVIVTINCGDHFNYEQIKERLQNLADEIGGNLSIKMA